MPFFNRQDSTKPIHLAPGDRLISDDGFIATRVESDDSGAIVLIPQARSICCDWIDGEPAADLDSAMEAADQLYIENFAA